MKDSRLLLILCLFAGVLINVGLHGMGWIARLVVPGLMIGVVFYVIIQVAMWGKKP